VLEKLEEMFSILRKTLLEEKAKLQEAVGRNPKGDMTYKFDLRVEELAVNCCKGLDFPVRILSEESNEILTKGGKPKYTLVIDPVDGSTNFKRGIELAGFSAAVLPGEKPLAVQNVEFALTGNLFTGSVTKAEKGKGTFLNGNKINASQTREIGKAFVNIDLDFGDRKKTQRILDLMNSVCNVRRLGSCAIELALVATGCFDAHIDIRDLSTPENFMAGYLLVKEAGGIFTDGRGRELGEIESLQKPHNIIAAGNKELHKQIIELLGDASN